MTVKYIHCHSSVHCDLNWCKESWHNNGGEQCIYFARNEIRWKYCLQKSKPTVMNSTVVLSDCCSETFLKHFSSFQGSSTVEIQAYQKTVKRREASSPFSLLWDSLVTKVMISKVLQGLLAMQMDFGVTLPQDVSQVRRQEKQSAQSSFLLFFVPFSHCLVHAYMVEEYCHWIL